MGCFHLFWVFCGLGFLLLFVLGFGVFFILFCSFYTAAVLADPKRFRGEAPIRRTNPDSAHFLAQQHLEFELIISHSTLHPLQSAAFKGTI